MLWNSFAKHVAHFSPTEQKKIQQAYEYGKSSHGEQKRKSGEPYFIHPIQTAITLIGLGADAETVMAALLHDVPEDTAVSIEDVEKHFGATVAKLVEGVTKIKSTDLEGNPNLDNRIETIRKMIVLLESDVRIMVIKLADRLHNMQTIQYMKPAKQQQYARETKEIFVPIADRLCMQDMRNALADLSIAVLDPNTHAQIAILNKKYDAKAVKVEKRVMNALTKYDHTKKLRTYSEDRSWQKWQKQIEEKNEENISVTLVFVCSTIGDCYQLLGNLHQIWFREQLSFQDYINFPTNNGYEAIHTTIILDDGERVRCKIRTQDMNDYAHKGITTKCFDNRAIGIINYLSWTKQIDPLTTDTSERSDEFWESLRSDILEESITIHGQDDQTVTVPEGATILDGLFYLYGDQALFVHTAEMDGQIAHLWDHIHRGARLKMNVYKHKSVQLQWLSFVNTSTSSTAIKQALSLQTKEHKLLIAEEYLQTVMTLHNKGNINEYAFKKAIGEEYTNSLLEIAEGKMDAMNLYNTLFVKQTPKKRTQQKEPYRIIRFSKPKTNDVLEQSIINTIAQIHFPFTKLKITTSKDNKKIHFSLKARVNSEELTILQAQLKDLNIHKVYSENIHEKNIFIATAVLLIILWSIDVFLSKLLLVPSFTFVDITLSRFVVLFICSIVFLSIQKIRSVEKIKFATINPLDTKLFSASLALFSTGLCTYIALQELQSIEYAALINLATIIVFSTQKRLQISDSLLVLSITLSSIIPITFYSEASYMSIITGIGAAMSFLMYSYFGKQFQNEQRIQSRYLYYILYMSLFTLLISVILVPLTTLHMLSVTQIAYLTLYHSILTALPYLLYFLFTKQSRLQAVGVIIPIFFPLVLIAASIQSQQWIHPLFYLVAFLSMYWIYTRRNVVNF